MQRIKFQYLIFPLVIPLLIWTFFASTLTVVLAQESQASPTPTVASQTGIYITVLGDEPFANVRSGPSASIFAVVGQLQPGDTAPALGRSPGGDWIQIEFADAPNGKGWVYSPLVVISSGTLQIAEPPPTPVPPATSTIDPTLAAQFAILPTNTRLPTFTPPAPISTSTLVIVADKPQSSSVPMAIVILSLGGFGVVGFILSLLFPRRSFS